MAKSGELMVFNVNLLISVSCLWSVISPKSIWRSEGKIEGDWVSLARDNILQKVTQHEDHAFNLLALCKSPLLTLPCDIAANIASISALSSILTTHLPDWKLFLDEEQLDLETGPNPAYGLTDHILEAATVPTSSTEAMGNAGEDGIVLLELYKDMVREQGRLKTLYLEEVSAIGQENDQAERRKHDYTPAIYESIKILAEKGVLKEIMEDIRSWETHIADTHRQIAYCKILSL